MESKRIICPLCCGKGGNTKYIDVKCSCLNGYSLVSRIVWSNNIEHRLTCDKCNGKSYIKMPKYVDCPKCKGFGYCY